MVWVNMYVLAPDREDNLEHREINLFCAFFSHGVL